MMSGYQDVTNNYPKIFLASKFPSDRDAMAIHKTAPSLELLCAEKLDLRYALAQAMARKQTHRNFD